MIRGMHHTSLTTQNAARLLSFYRDQMGLEQLWDAAWEKGTEPELARVVGMPDAAGRTITLRAGNSHVEIFEYVGAGPNPLAYRPASDAGIRHICFDVVDIESEFDRLSRAGIRFVSEPQQLPGAKSVYGFDPDGNIFELQEIDAGSMIPHIPFGGNDPKDLRLPEPGGEALTREVIRRHHLAWQQGDVPALMADYADDAVMISKISGVVSGKQAIADAFSAGFQTLFRPGQLRFEITSEFVAREYALVHWEAETAAFRAEGGFDAFTLHGGKIALQCGGATIVHKA